MTRLVILFAQLWCKRYQLFVPLIIFPTLMLAWSMMHERTFVATTTLHIDKSQARSPLLKNITDETNQQTLERFLKKEEVVVDTLQETGLLLDGTPKAEQDAIVQQFQNSVEIEFLSENTLRLSYATQAQQDMETVLETLSWNFIQEILTPERFRSELMLSSLAEQIRYYGTQEEAARNTLMAARNAPLPVENELQQQTRLKQIVALEFELQRASAQRQMAQDEYDKLFTESKALLTSLQGRGPNTVLRFIEPPTQIDTAENMDRHLSAVLQGVIFSILFSAFYIVFSQALNSSLKTDEDVLDNTGLKVLGHIPNLGKVSVIDGRISSEITTTGVK
jgi:hypothetical protein